jgi:hypothetical protein
LTLVNPFVAFIEIWILSGLGVIFFWDSLVIKHIVDIDSSLVVALCLFSSTLRMKAAFASETSVTFPRATQRNIPKKTERISVINHGKAWSQYVIQLPYFL